MFYYVVCPLLCYFMRLEPRHSWYRNADAGVIPTAFCGYFALHLPLAVLKAVSMISFVGIGTYECASFVGIIRVITAIHLHSQYCLLFLCISGIDYVNSMATSATRQGAALYLGVRAEAVGME
jgi:hypothetical protein